MVTVVGETDQTVVRGLCEGQMGKRLEEVQRVRDLASGYGREAPVVIK